MERREINGIIKHNCIRYSYSSIIYNSHWSGGHKKDEVAAIEPVGGQATDISSRLCDTLFYICLDDARLRSMLLPEAMPEHLLSSEGLLTKRAKAASEAYHNSCQNNEPIPADTKEGSSEIYTVTAYRWGDRENHSYIVGAFQVPGDNDKAEALALDAAVEESNYRGGKYECEILALEPMSTSYDTDIWTSQRRVILALPDIKRNE